MITRDFHGNQHWYPGEEKPPVVYSPSNRDEQRSKTIEGTARLLNMVINGKVQEKDYKEGLEFNAKKLELTPDKLHEEALSILEARNQSESNSETHRIS